MSDQIKLTLTLPKKEVLEALDRAAKTFGMSVKDGINVEDLVCEMQADFESLPYSDGMMEWFREAINTDSYYDFLERNAERGECGFFMTTDEDLDDEIGEW